ncbi:aspartate racemase [Endozoicomonas montiporae]|uniref:Aspartate racemase n=2 Tax=Endozoicomonas montiporae TaxID=1027273 RepID=A0A081N9Q8_9GAMM|nr:aspartate/glutamate racemase family protein [Endozoicomonas montiporae]AMO55035.1 aspartate racemase [Endozoicomonas montiporae CL-33]KEQ15181.1 aspartate racemase [Endozoicomonas montiporae]
MIQKTNQRMGIIGGMGNEAMVDLFEKMASYPEHKDREFIAFGNSRLAYKPDEVMHKWLPSDPPELPKIDTTHYTLAFMQHLGADLTGLACNSGHEHFRKVLPQLSLPFVDMLKYTAMTLEGTTDNVLVMGVNSLVDSGLYQSALAEQGVESTKPSPENQKKVMDAIYNPLFGIKTAQITPQAEALLCEVIRSESETQGCSKVVLGCTELPLALTQQSVQRFKQQGMIPDHIEVIDASQRLAEALVKGTGERQKLDKSLNDYFGTYTDWFQPISIKVSSLQSAAIIQKEIFSHTARYLADRNASIKGSYMHLPTLFFRENDTDIETSLSELNIRVHNEGEPLADYIESYLKDFFTDELLSL